MCKDFDIMDIIDFNDKQFEEAILRQILSKAISEWGIEAQTNTAIEEMGELIVAINHYRRGRAGIATVQEEIADVIIAMSQLAMINGEYDVQIFIEKKINRLQQRLKKKKEG